MKSLKHIAPRLRQLVVFAHLLALALAASPVQAEDLAEDKAREESAEVISYVDITQEVGKLCDFADDLLQDARKALQTERAERSYLGGLCNWCVSCVKDTRSELKKYEEKVAKKLENVKKIWKLRHRRSADELLSELAKLEKRANDLDRLLVKLSGRGVRSEDACGSEESELGDEGDDFWLVELEDSHLDDDQRSEFRQRGSLFQKIIKSYEERESRISQLNLLEASLLSYALQNEAYPTDNVESFFEGGDHVDPEALLVRATSKLVGLDIPAPGDFELGDDEFFLDLDSSVGWHKELSDEIRHFLDPDSELFYEPLYHSLQELRRHLWLQQSLDRGLAALEGHRESHDVVSQARDHSISLRAFVSSQPLSTIRDDLVRSFRVAGIGEDEGELVFERLVEIEWQINQEIENEELDVSSLRGNLGLFLDYISSAKEEFHAIHTEINSDDGSSLLSAHLAELEDAANERILSSALPLEGDEALPDSSSFQPEYVRAVLDVYGNALDHYESLISEYIDKVDKLGALDSASHEIIEIRARIETQVDKSRRLYHHQIYQALSQNLTKATEDLLRARKEGDDISSEAAREHVARCFGLLQRFDAYVESQFAELGPYPDSIGSSASRSLTKKLAQFFAGAFKKNGGRTTLNRHVLDWQFADHGLSRKDAYRQVAGLREEDKSVFVDKNDSESELGLHTWITDYPELAQASLSNLYIAANHLGEPSLVSLKGLVQHATVRQLVRDILGEESDVKTWRRLKLSHLVLIDATQYAPAAAFFYRNREHLHGALRSIVNLNFADLMSHLGRLGYEAIKGKLVHHLHERFVEEIRDSRELWLSTIMVGFNNFERGLQFPNVRQALGYLAVRGGVKLGAKVVREFCKKPPKARGCGDSIVSFGKKLGKSGAKGLSQVCRIVGYFGIACTSRMGLSMIAEKAFGEGYCSAWTGLATTTIPAAAGGLFYVSNCLESVGSEDKDKEDEKTDSSSYQETKSLELEYDASVIDTDSEGREFIRTAAGSSFEVTDDVRKEIDEIQNTLELKFAELKQEREESGAPLSEEDLSELEEELLEKVRNELDLGSSYETEGTEERLP